ncbi:PREDICTED: coiled-coil domain-containing protein 81-like isoform X5 [Lepidothrix coronata]|uniref:Coiled-coil domain-containing protein 81-like isoform X5 n=1 Tax=Lepidothrix coronata TaxID=321398 RepID=A0A6J0IZB3_9PASS|nr:PREDICTED: coiled-coil domain-containing protein 81-like isoform X5 [Lepidothrix coronata]
MEGCCTVSINKKQSCLFPTLLQLSTEEVVAIWDIVSVYILGQMKQDKGVLVPGLGTFAVVPEQVDGAEEVYVVRRPVFQLDMDVSCLRELMFPTVMIPGDIEIAPLDYWWLSQTTSLPPDVLRDCVEETVLLYSFQLRDRQRLAFAFGDIGVLSCQDNVLCMQFHRNCVEKLENWDTWVALLLTRLCVPDAGLSDGATAAGGMQAAWAHSFPRFQLALSEAFSTWHTKVAEKHRVRTGAQEHPDKFSLPMLPNQRQQEPGMKPSASVLPLSPGIFPGMGETGGQESAPSARLDTTLLASENCQRALQVSGPGGPWAPHPSLQPQRKGVTVTWGRAGTPLPVDEMVERFQPGTRHLSPRAIQVLHALEPHQTRRNIFTFLAENKRQRQKQQKQLCSSRCSSSGQGARAGVVAADVAGSDRSGRLLTC